MYYKVMRWRTAATEAAPDKEPCIPMNNFQPWELKYTMSWGKEQWRAMQQQTDMSRAHYIPTEESYIRTEELIYI